MEPPDLPVSVYTLGDFGHVVLGLIGDGYEIKLRIDNIVATPGLVMVERTESFTKHDGSGSFELPVVGVFESAAGKITLWRDYFHFDPAQWGVDEANPDVT